MAIKYGTRRLNKNGLQQKTDMQRFGYNIVVQFDGENPNV